MDTGVHTEQAETDREIGARLRVVRERAGLSLRETATALKNGTHFTTIGKVERGQIGLSNKLATALAGVYGVTKFELVDELQSAERIRAVPLFGSETLDPARVNVGATQLGWTSTLRGGEGSFAILGRVKGIFSNSERQISILIEPTWTSLKHDAIFLLELDDNTQFIGLYNADDLRFVSVFADAIREVEVGRDPFKVIGRAISAEIEL